MADINSATIVNLIADPIVFNEVRHNQARLYIKSDTVSIVAADDDADVLRFFRVRSCDSIKSLQVRTSGIAGFTDADVGLHTIGTNGAAVDADLYGDALTLATEAPATPHVVATAAYLEGRSLLAPSTVNNAVWEDLGLSADPVLEYDVTITANTIGAATGTVSLTMLYTAGS